MSNYEWHDLRKNPDDLPEKEDDVWVILSEKLNEVVMDSYNPNDKGKIVTIPAYDHITDDGKVEHHDERQFESSGWWAYDEPGWVTHWMYVDICCVLVECSFESVEFVLQDRKFFHFHHQFFHHILLVFYKNKGLGTHPSFTFAKGHAQLSQHDNGIKLLK